jgi:hypothetical protein
MEATSRTFILFVFILLSFYCLGARMMDYFAIYEPWKIIDEKAFPAFHHYQRVRGMNIFVIPAAVMTLFNILAVSFTVDYVKVKWLWLSLFAISYDWIFSFTIQIPLQLELETRKDMRLIEELLNTTWFRFTADIFQVLFVCILLLELLKQTQLTVKARQ